VVKMALGTGEVFAWLIFLVIVTMLFFAAFGQSNITEDTIEEYMDNLVTKIQRGEK
jgi:Na+-transporting methylmalonyl-CoA/oxaloacetate decarboxylase gamma subunit